MTPETQFTKNGDVTIAYETFGDLTVGEPLLLLMGLDFQMVWWPDALCAQLVERGFAVVRFDNRDTGLSTHFDSAKKQNPFKALLGGTEPAYTSIDMLDDACAVMDAVGWDSANVMGGSMGAGLAQGLALTYPDRVKALISVMGLPVDTSGFATLKYIKFGVFNKLRKIKPTEDPAGQVEALVDIYRAIASPGYPFPDEWVRATAIISNDRSPRDPKSTQRQLAAGRAQKMPSLSNIEKRTLVICGDDDPMISRKGSVDTAARIGGSKLVTYPGMGHNLPSELWPTLIDEVCEVTGLGPERAS